VIASCLAYGRVTSFCVVLDRLFALMDEAGGPATYVRQFDSRDAERLAPLVYRFNRGPDFALLFSTLQAALDGSETLAHRFATSQHETAKEGLVRGISSLREIAATLENPSRGFHYLLPSPATGSACKRWCMFLRWMVRPEDGVDFGLWSTLTPGQLVVPLDTHVARISRFIGLTQRKDASWRTAVEVTDTLKQLDPDDPIRYDFAIAHLGISGACKGYRIHTVCSSCPLDPVCVA
jgi:uncharacterized protein (TIGR02757 family)